MRRTSCALRNGVKYIMGDNEENKKGVDNYVFSLRQWLSHISLKF